MTITNWT